MADLPRWVERWDVDSTAMLNAFVRYHYEVSEALKQKHGTSFQPIWEGQLWSYIHENPSFLDEMPKGQMPMQIPQRPCQKIDCARCGVRGGFVFRWYSPYWAKYYNNLRRPGSWEAPDLVFANRHGGKEYWLQQERFWRPVIDML